MSTSPTLKSSSGAELLPSFEDQIQANARLLEENAQRIAAVSSQIVHTEEGISRQQKLGEDTAAKADGLRREIREVNSSNKQLGSIFGVAIVVFSALAIYNRTAFIS
ncbi:MAG: hypothetical protein K1000chlam4_00209 [Chlamydiae bacterium]|nr:hypothetical protein [Chlamydiota bacterium]